MRYADRKVVHNSRRALTIERDQRPRIAEANNATRLVLADHREAEHFLVEIDRALQIGDLNADMIDVCALEIALFLRDGSRSAGSQDRERSSEISPGERTVFEAGQNIGNDRLHGVSFRSQGIGQRDYRT